MEIKYLEKDTVSIINNNNWKSYINSEQGRQELQTEVPEPYLSEILTVWGDIPTVAEYEEIQEPLPQPTLEERNRADIDYLSIMTGVDLDA